MLLVGPPFFIFAHLRAGAVSGTESAVEGAREGAAGDEQRERGPFRALKMRPVRQEAVHSLWSRLFCGPLKMRRVPQEPVLRTFEDASRTTGGCFWHRISLPYRRSLFFTPNASENASRTPGSLFEHGTHIPYRRWPSPVPNARHRGKLLPLRSLANILVGLIFFLEGGGENSIFASVTIQTQ